MRGNVLLRVRCTFGKKIFHRMFVDGKISGTCSVKKVSNLQSLRMKTRRGSCEGFSLIVANTSVSWDM